MKKLILFLLLFSLFVPVQSVQAEGEMLKLYLVPIQQIGSVRGPKYFVWRFNEVGIGCRWNMMDYGNFALLVAHDITPADHASLIANADVYAFPDNLDQNINDKAVLDSFFEPLNIPTDWTTPSTTYRQFVRQTAGLMQFNQRYTGLSGGESLFGGGITLESNYNQLSAQQQAWFNQALISFGWFTGVQGNPKLRSLAKQAGDLWGDAPFIFGGVVY
jgi:hypothetical protein